MCFTPAVSISTAIIEWGLALVLIAFWKKSKIAPPSSLLLFLLGLYQFAEFGLCTQGNEQFWGTLAFLSYTFLPVLGLHLACMHLRKKMPSFLYAFPLVLAITPFVVQKFINFAFCETIFVTIEHFYSGGWQMLVYTLYYAGYISGAFFLLAGEKPMRSATKWGIAAYLLMTVPTFILLIIFPAWSFRFGSILCHFAILTAIAFFVAVWKDVHARKII